jgi:hypothetical protein
MHVGQYLVHGVAVCLLVIYPILEGRDCLSFKPHYLLNSSGMLACVCQGRPFQDLVSIVITFSNCMSWGGGEGGEVWFHFMDFCQCPLKPFALP